VLARGDCQKPGGWQGDSPAPGRQPAAPLRAGALRARRCRRSAVPAPAGRQSRPQRAHDDRARRVGRAVRFAPGVLSPRKAQPGRSAVRPGMSQGEDWRRLRRPLLPSAPRMVRDRPSGLKTASHRACARRPSAGPDPGASAVPPGRMRGQARGLPGRRATHVATGVLLASLTRWRYAPPLSGDLPRQDPGTYQKDGAVARLLHDVIAQQREADFHHLAR
jgi:hypothetical protein